MSVTLKEKWQTKNIFEIRSKKGVRILNQDEAKFWKKV